jgi:hypothetical protein
VYLNIVSSLSYCEYVRIRSNNGLSSVKKKFVRMGSRGPAFMGPHVLNSLHMRHQRTSVEHNPVIIQLKRTLYEGLIPHPPSRSCTSYWDKDASPTKESEIQVLQYNEDIIYRIAANAIVLTA